MCEQERHVKSSSYIFVCTFHDQLFIETPKHSTAGQTKVSTDILAPSNRTLTYCLEKRIVPSTLCGQLVLLLEIDKSKVLMR